MRRRVRMSVVALMVAGLASPALAAPNPSGGVALPGGDQCVRGSAHNSGLALADGLLKGVVHIKPFPPVTIGDDPDWSIDPFRNRTWVARFHTLMFTEALRLAWVQTSDPRYLARWTEIVTDWIDDNPMVDPPSWASWAPRITAVRAQLLACAVDHLPPLSMYRLALLEHARLLADPAFYVIRGNFALEQSMGLLAAACKLGHQKWTGLAKRRIERLVDRSIDPQGGSDEGSLGYALLNHTWYGEARRRLAACGQEISEHIQLGRRRLAEFVVRGTLPDGTLPLVGDTTLKRLPAGLSREGDFLLTRGNTGRVSAGRHHWYKRAGWVFDRSSWVDPGATHLVLRTGRVPIHNHKDQGSLVLAGYGRRLLEEAGLFGYGTKHDRYFKGPTGHNLLLVDGARYRNRDAVVTRRDGHGYVAYRMHIPIWEGVRWTRTVVSIRGADLVVVVDRAEAKRPQTFRQTWHLAPGSAPAPTAHGVRTTFKRGNLAIGFAGDPVRLRFVRGARGSGMQGWISYRLAKMQPAPVIEAVRRSKTFDLVTVLAPGPGTPEIRSLERIERDLGFSLTARVRGKLVRMKIANQHVKFATGAPKPIEAPASRARTKGS